LFSATTGTALKNLEHGTTHRGLVGGEIVASHSSNGNELIDRNTRES
jgi:hypothetical protein